MPYLLFIAALAFAASPFLVPGFGGFEADQFPVAQINPPVQPAGYAFGLWGLIYLWLIAGTGFQALLRRDDPAWDNIRPPLLISLIIGAAWLPVALVSPVWATVLIWIMWATAALALMRAPRGDGWFGHGPVGLYTGWLTAAASVSVGLMLAGYGVMAQLPAALIALVLALALALALQMRRRDAITLPIGVIWALIGVCVANWPDGPRPVLALAALGALLLGALTLRALTAR